MLDLISILSLCAYDAFNARLHAARCAVRAWLHGPCACARELEQVHAENVALRQDVATNRVLWKAQQVTLEEQRRAVQKRLAS
jgi:hypothetical protein